MVLWALVAQSVQIRLIFCYAWDCHGFSNLSSNRMLPENIGYEMALEHFVFIKNAHFPRKSLFFLHFCIFCINALWIFAFFPLLLHFSTFFRISPIFFSYADHCCPLFLFIDYTAFCRHNLFHHIIVNYIGCIIRIDSNEWFQAWLENWPNMFNNVFGICSICFIDWA